jgi:hypothetical protein
MTTSTSETIVTEAFDKRLETLRKAVLVLAPEVQKISQRIDRIGTSPAARFRRPSQGRAAVAKEVKQRKEG